MGNRGGDSIKSNFGICNIERVIATCSECNRLLVDTVDWNNGAELEDSSHSFEEKLKKQMEYIHPKSHAHSMVKLTIFTSNTVKTAHIDLDDSVDLSELL